jgi:hypothetical protein
MLMENGFIINSALPIFGNEIVIRRLSGWINKNTSRLHELGSH